MFSLIQSSVVSLIVKNRRAWMSSAILSVVGGLRAESRCPHSDRHAMDCNNKLINKIVFIQTKAFSYMKRLYQNWMLCEIRLFCLLLPSVGFSWITCHSLDSLYFKIYFYRSYETFVRYSSDTKFLDIFVPMFLI